MGGGRIRTVGRMVGAGRVRAGVGTGGRKVGTGGGKV